jgi:hypothetical protein
VSAGLFHAQIRVDDDDAEFYETGTNGKMMMPCLHRLQWILRGMDSSDSIAT